MSFKWASVGLRAGCSFSKDGRGSLGGTGPAAGACGLKLLPNNTQRVPVLPTLVSLLARGGFPRLLGCEAALQTAADRGLWLCLLSRALKRRNDVQNATLLTISPFVSKNTYAFHKTCSSCSHTGLLLF